MWVHKSADLYSVGLKGSFHLVRLHEISPGIAELKVGSARHKVCTLMANAVTVDVDGYNHPVERATGGVVRAPAPGVVVSIDVQRRSGSSRRQAVHLGSYEDGAGRFCLRRGQH